MTTQIAIAYGEVMTDTAIQRSNPLPLGVYEGAEPSITGNPVDGYVATLAPGARGVTVWRTKGFTPYHGAATIYESANLTFAVDIPNANPRIDLLVGAHKWVEGAMDGTGAPTGEITAPMAPVYAVVKGTPSATPVAPTVADPFDADGRKPTILAQVLVKADGSVVITRWAPTDMRLERFLKQNIEGRLDPAFMPYGEAFLPVYASTTLLKAWTTRVDNTEAIVSGVGVYQYDAASVAAADGDNLFAGNDGIGRWVRVLAAVDTAALMALIDAKHSKIGTEIHTGAFRVTEPPVEADDVIRLEDIQTGVAAPFANIASYRLITGQISKPYAAGNTPIVGLGELMRSGVGLTQLPGGGFYAGAEGVYRLAVQLKGNQAPADFFYASSVLTVAVKRAATPGAGFAEVLFYGQDFNGSGKCETSIPGEFATYLNVGDIVGIFSVAYEVTNRLYFTSQNLGIRAPTETITITNANLVVSESSPQTYPDNSTFNLTADNAIGAITWSLDAAGAMQMDGTTDPKAEIINGNQCKITWTADPVAPKTWGIKLRATDSHANVATKTINLTLNAAQALSIPTGDQSFAVYEDDYPYSVLFNASALGGTPPYTWSLVAGADTTLPSAAIVAGTGAVSGTVAAAGVTKVRVKATDSAGSPANIEKVINITVTTLVAGGGGGGGAGCFTAPAFVLMADGTGKPIATVDAKEMILGVEDTAHQSGIQEAAAYEVQSVSHHEGLFDILGFQGVQATPEHRWGVQTEEGARLWVPTSALNSQDAISVRNPTPEWFKPTSQPEPAGQATEVFNLQTACRTYFVGPTADGPWFLVHNVKIEYLLPE